MRAILSALFIILLLPLTATAHELRPAVADIRFTQGSFEVEFRVTLEALIAEVDPNLSDTSESQDAARYDALRLLPPSLLAKEFTGYEAQFLSAITATIDGEHLPTSTTALDIPEVGDIELVRDTTLKIKGKIPAGAQELTFGWSENLGPLIVRVTTPEGEDGYSAYLQSGQLTDPISVIGVTQQSGLSVFANYIAIGFEHIIPKGLDHILFVVGLFLLSTQMRPLLWQISSFTLAHTISLAMGMLGWVTVPPAIVEPLIAASIVYVSIENVFMSGLSRWRPYVVFGFGLLHGLGFAGVLTEVGFVQSQFVSGLIGFNIGVELGQLTVIALCFALFGAWFGRKSWYRAVITIPLSLGVAAIGAYWLIERTLLAA
ncbi:MAG: HupE/UreJ family protein [Rhodobacteraceae bacterium]|nr:HupE/UreJ family protein [Paracoccaceae bacterium]